MPEPEWQVIGNEFWTTFHFTEQATAIQLDSVKIDKAKANTAHDAGQVTGQVEQLLLLLTEDLSRKEMMEKLGLKGRDNFEKLYLTPALNDGLAEMTIPDKPNSRLQKYRLTEKGRLLVSIK